MNGRKRKNMSVSQKTGGLFAESKKRAQNKMKKRRGNFFHEVKEELKKVSWTSKDELKVCTKIVIGATFVLGVGIYIADLVLKGALNGISKLVYVIGG
jgi:preprotein translocase subunit SecE